MKKILFLPVLLIAALSVFVSCNDDDKPYVFYVWDEPAITDSLENVPVIKTAYGIYYAPGLDSKLEKGTQLWVSFVLDEGLERIGSFYTATNLRYTTINTSAATIISGALPGNEDGYTDSIDVALLYNSYIDNFLYFGFKQQASEGQKFDYILYCNTDSVADGIPTVYIKAKMAESGAGNKKETLINYGFDMTSFLNSDLVTDLPVKFNIEYKIGTKDGKDVYKSFKTSPIIWDKKLTQQE